MFRSQRSLAFRMTALCLCLTTVGCATVEPHRSLPLDEPDNIPNELCRVTMPEYRIEPPDILLIDAIRVVPRSPYYLRALDAISIIVQGTLPDEPIAGPYRIDPGGGVTLGPSYGTVQVAGLTLDEAKEAIQVHLEESLRAPEVSVTLAEPAAKEQITGEFLVCPDGSINLGTYGTVYVAGMTLKEAKAAVEDALSEFLDKPEVSVDMYAYNSKHYYVIAQGLSNGEGDALSRWSMTGNETVLDALAQINGLQSFSSKRVWIARPTPDGLGYDQILKVDWSAISRGGGTATNYQVLPGDRIFIAEAKLGAFGDFTQNVTQPFTQIFGFSSLGVQVVQSAFRFPSGFRGANVFGGGLF